MNQSEEAYEAILLGLIFGDLPAGALIRENELASRYGVGLAAVRHALARLANEGLLERLARVGTRVLPLGIREMQEVFEARLILEGSGAALAAERATAQDLAALDRAFVGYEKVIAARNFRKLVAMDRVFHRALAAATQNRLMAATIVQLHNNSSRFWYFSLARLDPAVVRADIATHLKVVQAVRRRDPAAAMQQMRAVLGHFPKDVHVFFTQQLRSQKEVPAHEQHRVRRWVGKRPEKTARTASRLS